MDWLDRTHQVIGIPYPSTTATSLRCHLCGRETCVMGQGPVFLDGLADVYPRVVCRTQGRELQPVPPDQAGRRLEGIPTLRIDRIRLSLLVLAHSATACLGVPALANARWQALHGTARGDSVGPKNVKLTRSHRGAEFVGTWGLGDVFGGIKKHQGCQQPIPSFK